MAQPKPLSLILPCLLGLIVWFGFNFGSSLGLIQNFTYWLDKGYYARDADEKIQCYTKAIEDRGSADSPILEANAYNGRASACLAKGKAREAIQDASQAIQLNPKYLNAYITRGTAYFETGEYDKAVQDLKQELQEDSANYYGYFLRGSVYLWMGQYDKAIEDASHAIGLYPNFAEAYSVRGGAFEGKGEYEKALQDCSKAIQLNPRSASAYILRGDIYAEKGKYEEALQDYSQALSLDPKGVENYDARVGWTYFMEGKLDDSLKELDKVLAKGELPPGLGFVYGTKLLICQEMNDQEAASQVLLKAEGYFKRQIENRPGDMQNLSELARIYCDANAKPDEALQLAKKAVESQPNFWAYAVLGLCQLKNKNYREAIESLEKSRQLNPSYTRNLLWLGNAQDAAGNREEAKQTWRKALEINPKDRFILKALEQLK